MNYSNPFINPYGYGQQMPGQYMQPGMQGTQMSLTNQQQVVRVNGENGARAFQIGANSSALLLDESGLMVWLVTSDGAGYKTVQAYDIAPHQTAQAPDYGGLESRIKRLEEIVNGYTGNSSAAGEKQHGPAGATRAADDEHGAYRTESAGGAKPAYYEQPTTEAGYGPRSEARRRSDGGTA